MLGKFKGAISYVFMKNLPLGSQEYCEVDFRHILSKCSCQGKANLNMLGTLYHSDSFPQHL